MKVIRSKKRIPVNGATEIKSVAIPILESHGKSRLNDSKALVVNAGEVTICFHRQYHLRIVAEVAQRTNDGKETTLEEMTVICLNAKTDRGIRRLSNKRSIYNFWRGLGEGNEPGQWIDVLDRDGNPIGDPDDREECVAVPGDSRRNFLAKLFLNIGSVDSTADFRLGAASEPIRFVTPATRKQDNIAAEVTSFRSRSSNEVSHPITPDPEIQRCFDAIIADKTDGFEGRKFVFEAFGEFLEAHESGYFTILGVPGIGKSALIARLVKDRQCVHHFNVATQGIRSIRTFLGNVCVQLIERYQLNYDKLPSSAFDDSGFLLQCLSEAAENNKHHPIVLAIDALDESDRTGLPSAANTLYLPSSLPQGVYVISTTRELDDIRLNVKTQRRLYLDAGAKDNQQDINRYIRTFMKRPAMQNRLAVLRARREDFIAMLCEKSQGNFMYLHCVLPAIEEGRFISGTLDELPDGLMEYYQRHWRQMRDGNEAEFDNVYEPVICSLAVAQAPISVLQIAKWTQINSGRVKAVVRQWREFLEEERVGTECRYRIYHTSFQDFLNDKVGLQQYDELIDNYYERLSRRKA